MAVSLGVHGRAVIAIKVGVTQCRPLLKSKKTRRMKNPEPRSNVLSSLPPVAVAVTVPARLHLGFLDLNGGLGRSFGSIGLAINGLKTSITFNAASQLRVTGPENERVRGYLQVMQRALDIENTCHVRIDEVV